MKMVRKNKITRKELKNRLVLLILALFSWFLLAPIYDSLTSSFQLTPTTQFLIGLGGITLILYFYNI